MGVKGWIFLIPQLAHARTHTHARMHTHTCTHSHAPTPKLIAKYYDYFLICDITVFYNDTQIYFE